MKITGRKNLPRCGCVTTRESRAHHYEQFITTPVPLAIRNLKLIAWWRSVFIIRNHLVGTKQPITRYHLSDTPSVIIHFWQTPKMLLNSPFTIEEEGPWDSLSCWSMEKTTRCFPFPTLFALSLIGLTPKRHGFPFCGARSLPNFASTTFNCLRKIYALKKIVSFKRHVK